MPIIFRATIYCNDDEIEEHGDEREIELPGQNHVCPECDGQGFVMNPSMRGHAYSPEEWEDEIPESQRQAIAAGHRSIYDQDCPTCKGEKVILVPDQKQIMQHGTDEQKQHLRRWVEQERDRKKFLREWAQEIRTQELMGGCRD